jgi:hypothetical protein
MAESLLASLLLIANPMPWHSCGVYAESGIETKPI